MKKLALSLTIAFLAILPVSLAHAVHVSGYYRANGTYVQPYERTAPDGNPYNNYGYPGNYNPNTGTITGGNPTTYLNNYYGTSGSSGSSYSPSTYSYPTTPSCPLFSSYNGSSCTCNSGYVLSGSQCVSGSLYCVDQIGLMSQYDSSSRTCSCMSGYTLTNGTCTYTPTYTPTYYPPTPTAPSCPANSAPTLADPTSCYCNTGYQASADKSACVLIPTTTTQSYSAPSTTRTSAGLTMTQVNAILGLLQSFGADATTVANVAVILEK